MLFLDKLGKKPQAPKQPISADEVKEFSAKGMSDRDIIKTFKDRGYDYDEIEKAMLQAVKEGVSTEEPADMPMAPPPEQQPEYSYPEQEQFAPPDLASDQPPDLKEEQFSPELIVEELVEGVVEEKWKKFEEHLDSVGKEIETMQISLKQMQQKVDQIKPAGDTTELQAKVLEVSEKVEDMDARIGGLEKAFRQFLPQLTRNIESLSNIIHEMKSKQNVY